MRRTARTLLRWAGLAAVATALLLVTGLSQPARAGVPATVVRIDPANQSVPAGTDLMVTVRIDAVTDPDGLGTYEFILSFDPNVLTFESFANGAFLGSTGRGVSCVPPRTDVDGDTIEDPGFVRVGCNTFAPSPAGPTGDGLLATVTLSTSCAGSSIVTFSKMNLGDPLAGDIQAGISGGNATVTGGEPCSGGGLVGDANCNDTVNAIDAAIILQHDAGLLATIPCADLADVNGSGEANALDALLVLQYDAGLLDQLPP